LRPARIPATTRTPAYRIAMVEDISERVAAQERREGDEAKYRAIIGTAVDSIVLIDESGNIQAFNPAAEKTFGYRSCDVIGRNVHMLMHKPDRSRHDDYISNYRRTGHAKIIGIGREVTGQRKDGSLFPLELSIGEWRAGGERYFTGIMRDVTERKYAEEALRALATELGKPRIRWPPASLTAVATCGTSRRIRRTPGWPGFRSKRSSGGRLSR
jgi:PAS domain S-box-containing protein